MLRIFLRSYDHKILDKFCQNLLESLLNNGLAVRGIVFLPNRKKVWTFLSGPHVNKTSRVQLELRQSKRLISVDENTGEKTVPEILGSLNLGSTIQIMIR